MSSIGSGVQGLKDGIAEEAQFYYPTAIAASESDGSLLVCDFSAHRIIKISFKGIYQADSVVPASFTYTISTPTLFNSLSLYKVLKST